MNASMLSLPSRAQLSYAIEGLVAREELLLKSLVRLLDNRTQHQWVYHPAAPDVWIVQDGKTIPAAASGRSSAHVVKVTSQNLAQPGYISLPLRPQDIEGVLNKTGNLILETRTQAAPGVSDSTYPCSYRLIRWPRVNVLNGPERLRMATLLVSRPYTVQELSQQTSLSLAVCDGFIDDLQATGLIEKRYAQAAPVQARSTAPDLSKPIALPEGLFARIRSRLLQRSGGGR